MYGKVTEATAKMPHASGSPPWMSAQLQRSLKLSRSKQSEQNITTLWAGVFCDETSGYAVGNARCLDSKCFGLNDWKFLQMPLPVISVVKGGQIFPSSLCSERMGISP